MRKVSPRQTRAAFSFAGNGFATATLHCSLLRPARLRLITSDCTEELLEGRYVMVLGCNTRHTGGMRIAPHARLDDGLLDLIIVPKLSRRRLLALMSRIPSGRHLEAPELRYRQVSGFEILVGKGGGRPGRNGWCLNVDGKILRETQAAVLKVSVCRGALKLLSALA